MRCLLSNSQLPLEPRGIQGCPEDLVVPENMDKMISNTNTKLHLISTFTLRVYAHDHVLAHYTCSCMSQKQLTGGPEAPMAPTIPGKPDGPCRGDHYQQPSIPTLDPSSKVRRHTHSLSLRSNHTHFSSFSLRALENNRSSFFFCEAYSSHCQKMNSMWHNG